MSDVLLLDPDPAMELHGAFVGIANEIDDDRRFLAPLTAQAAEILDRDIDGADRYLASVADELRSLADDLDNRIRMAIFGGPVINAGMRALEDIRSAWDTIDNRGGSNGNRDGVVGRNDLEWAAENLHGDAAVAARWLLDHEEFFAAVETASHRDDYIGLDAPGTGANGDGKIAIADIDAYITQLDTWATLIPYLANIDIAAHGGDLDGVMSRNDFEAFLANYDLPPDVIAAAQQVLDDGAHHDTSGIPWGTILLVASMIPIVGDFVDAATALYHLSQGNWTEAALSGIGILPIPGVSGGSTRAVREGVEEVAETAAQRAAREGATDNWGSYTPDRSLPRHRGGYPEPDVPDAPHTQLGRRGVGDNEYSQARQWEWNDELDELQPTRDVDFSDHGFPDDHPMPHQHENVLNNESVGVRSGAGRGDPMPLVPGWLIGE